MNRDQTIWQDSAASNIALIKYMGKFETQGNIPSNSSLSYTLGHLKSVVRLRLKASGPDEWQPLQGEEFLAPSLSEAGQKRFLEHLLRIKKYFSAEEYFFGVESANNFPGDCGLASSASSFAALTRTAVRALCELKGLELPSVHEQAELSRQASGSSCRSFFDQWALWEGEKASSLDLAVGDLDHMAVVVESDKKLVSSSEAHRRVTSSLLFEGRPERADRRKKELVQALGQGLWRQAFEICWAEFWDMHALFETSKPPFSYMLPESLEVLRYCQNLWASHGDAPLVTMDAGANIHLLFRREQLVLQRQVYGDLKAKFRVMSSREFDEL